MLYKDFVNSVENPLDKENFIDDLIKVYVDSSDYYTGIVHFGIDDKVVSKYIPQARDELEVYLFNTWKENLLKYASTCDDKKVRELARYVNNFDPKTTREIEQIHRDLDKHEDLYETYWKYDYKRLGRYTDWTHICSDLVQFDNSYDRNISHRLYVNCDSHITEVIAKMFIDRCTELGLGYYFKYDEYADRADSLVVYSNTAYLPVYARILKEIKVELESADKKLKNAFHKPSLLTGSIDGWLGYGSEPSKEEDTFLQRSDRSYNAKRAIHIEECIRKELVSFLRRNKDRKLTINGYDSTYAMLFAKVAAKYIQEDRLEDCKNDLPGATKRRGYSKSDIASFDYEATVTKAVLDNYDKFVDSYANRNIFAMSVPFKEGEIEIHLYDVSRIIKKNLEMIARSDPKFKRDLLNRIKATSKDYNITNHYAFDRYAMELLYNEEKAMIRRQTAKKQSTSRQEPTKQQDTIIVDKGKPTSKCPKTNTKILKYTHKAMTDDEIHAARKRLGME